MAKCGCGSSGTCGCLVVAGEGVRVTGSGASSNPYRVSADIPDLSNAFVVNDSDTLDLELFGAGTPTDPLTLSGNVKMSMATLSDVADEAAPAVGDVPVWTIDGATAGWRFQPPPTVAPGTINLLPTGGLRGDGSAPNPLAVATSGIWGVNVGDGNEDSTTGQPIYVDSAGQLRAAPVTIAGGVSWSSLTGRPTAFPTTWTLVSQKPSSFPSSWGSVSGKPTEFPPEPHDHDGRYYTETEANEWFAAKPGSIGGRAVMDVTAAHQMGLRWNGRHVVVRVDNSEREIASRTEMIALAGGAGSDKVNAFGDENTARHARGPDATAYTRGMSGSGFFSVWMDNTYQFGRNTSSERFKTDIEPMDISLDTALALADQVVTFRRIGSDERYETGVIAERVNEVFPQAVTWFAEPDTEVVEEPALEVVETDEGPQVRTVVRQVERAVPGISSKPLEIDGVRYDLLALPALKGVKALYEQMREERDSAQRKHDRVLARLRKIEAHLGLTNKEN